MRLNGILGGWAAQGKEQPDKKAHLFAGAMRKTYGLSHSLAPVAQLDRALVSGTKGRRFESYRVYQTKEVSLSGLFCLVYVERLKPTTATCCSSLRILSGVPDNDGQ